jgi:hypothetical protein
VAASADDGTAPPLQPPLPHRRVGQLIISQALYDDLRQVPTDQLSLRQFAQLRLHEAVLPLQQALEAARTELQGAKAAVALAEARSEERCRDLAHRTVLAEGREGGLRDQNAALESTVRRLEASVAAATAQAESLHGKGVAYDLLDARKRELESIHEKEARLVATLEAALEVARADREAALADMRDLRTKVELLSADKATLAAAHDEARASARHSQDRLAVAEEQVREATRQREAYQQQLLRTQHEARSQAEERVETEVRRLREAGTKELEEIRAATREGYERELRALREDRANAVAEAERLRQRLDLQQQTAEEAAASLKAQVVDLERTCAELRGQLRVRCFEAERLQLAHAEQADALAKSTAQAEALREKVSVLQTEYARLDASADKELITLRASLVAEKERLAAYDRLEAELDDAILLAGHAEADGAAAPAEGALLWGASGAVDAAAGSEAAAAGASAGASRRSGGGPLHGLGSSLGLTLAAGAPTTARRRLRQTVLLAKELMQAQQEAAALKNRCTELETVAAAAREAADDSAAQLDAVRGPQAYAAQALRQKEQELRTARTEAARLREELSVVRRALMQLDTAREAAESELRRVAGSRREIDALADLVQQAIRAQEPHARLQYLLQAAQHLPAGGAGPASPAARHRAAEGGAGSLESRHSSPLSAGELGRDGSSSQSSSPSDAGPTRDTPLGRPNHHHGGRHAHPTPAQTQAQQQAHEHNGAEGSASAPASPPLHGHTGGRALFASTASAAVSASEGGGGVGGPRLFHSQASVVLPRGPPLSPAQAATEGLRYRAMIPAAEGIVFSHPAADAPENAAPPSDAQRRKQHYPQDQTGGAPSVSIQRVPLASLHPTLAQAGGFYSPLPQQQQQPLVLGGWHTRERM